MTPFQTRRPWLALSILALVAGVARAQAPPVRPVHGHPQRTVYTTQAEWPTDSFQCHWQPDITSPDTPQHTHLDLTFPRYSEITAATDNFIVPFTIKLFHVRGSVKLIYGDLIRDIVFDTQGPLDGDPHDLVIRTGHLTVDILHAPQTVLGIPLGKGWFGLKIVARTFFDDGSRTDTTAVEPLFALFDPASAEVPAHAGGMVLTTRCDVNGADGQAVTEVISEAQDALPLTAIDSPWGALWAAYNYPPDFAMPQGTFQQLVDPNFHVGLPGTLLFRDAVDNSVGFKVFPVLFDPAKMGSGPHTMLGMWSQPVPTVSGDSLISALLVTTVTVGPHVPPPTPTDTWTTQAGVLQRLGLAGAYRFCATPDHCVTVTMPVM